MNPADLRKDYTRTGLLEQDCDPDPIRQFERWFREALDAGVEEPNAMTLATATREGDPSARVVLLKGYDQRGFVFFTNLESHKGRELEDNPRAALVFLWKSLERQVRVTGSVSRVSREETDAYFRTRPVGSRLGAWASRQSEVIGSREVLEASLAEVTARFSGQEIPAPPFWGGLRVMHEAVEFWQGRPNRLHDRIRYRKTGGTFARERLSP